jgi:predicted acetyltransferase
MSHPDVIRDAITPIEIVAVLPAEMSVLRNLFQFYEYDFSAIEAARVGDDGRFHHLERASFEHSYFIKAKGSLAGFALVNRHASCVIDGEVVWWMEEFFIMRRYRRASLGRQAAHAVIERHPGTWELTETPNNHAATAFWRTVLTAYAYEEFEFEDPKWGRRPLQRFSIRWRS